MIYRSNHESIISAYQDMIDYYLENIGELSKYSNYRVRITERIIVNIVRRFNEIVPDYGKIVLNGELKDDGREENTD